MRELKEFKPLSIAEQTLIDTVNKGERIIFGEELPQEETPANTIRADLIRHLLLSRFENVVLHEKGLRIRGAFIAGSLDLQGAETSFDLSFSKCVFEQKLKFVNARMRGLFLNGAQIPGFSADNAIFDGSMFLRNGFVSTNEISLPGATITGDLQICDAEILAQRSSSLFAPSLKVDGSIYLGDYPYDDSDTELRASGSIQLSAAKIGQDFYCRNAAISPDDTELGHSNFLDLETRGMTAAISLARAEISGVLYFKNNQISGGHVNLAGARARRLNDDPSTDGSAYRLRLDGFEYSSLAQDADSRLDARLDWLARRPAEVEFTSQPYEQLAKALNAIGHRDDATQVLMEKERLKRQANLETLKLNGMSLWRAGPMVLADFILRWLVGYGYRPIRALLWGAFFIASLAIYFQIVWDAGDMAPNAAPILVSKDWVAATQTHADNPAKFWSSPGQAGQDYETFNAVAYAADLMIPIVSLGQEAAWAPSTSRSHWGWHGWWIRWFAKIAGWIVTALGAAAITGLIRND